MTLDLTFLKREARKKGTPATRLLELAGMGPELARQVARSDNTPPDVLARLAAHDDTTTVKVVAANPHTPGPTLARLASHPEPLVVLKVACNSSTPEATIRELARHPKKNIRQGVACNRAAPLDVLVGLRDDHAGPTMDGLTTLSRYGGNAWVVPQDYPEAALHRAVTLTDLIPAEAAQRLAGHPSPAIRQLLLLHGEKIASSVRTQILKQLEGLKGATP